MVRNGRYIALTGTAPGKDLGLLCATHVRAEMEVESREFVKASCTAYVFGVPGLRG